MNWFKVPSVSVFAITLLSPIGSATCAASPAQPDDPAKLPSNIHVAQVLAPVVARLRSTSPTFTGQWDRIAQARLVKVIVSPVMGASTTSRGRARATLQRFSSGVLLAAVEMPVPLTEEEYAELLGHEFEHIIEQIDRVDLEALSAARAGATRLPDGAYETTRARRAGQAIAGEVVRPKPATLIPASSSRSDSAPISPRLVTAGGGEPRQR